MDGIFHNFLIITVSRITPLLFLSNNSQRHKELSIKYASFYFSLESKPARYIIKITFTYSYSNSSSSIRTFQLLFYVF